MKELNGIKGNKMDLIMDGLGQSSKKSSVKRIFKSTVVGALLFLNVACVMTPDGDIGVVGGVGVDVVPQIVTSSNSFVSVRLGPSFYASDAYLLAYDYCLNRGLYAYEFSPWAHSSSIVRELRYDCRPTYIAPPIVYNVHRRNHYRYNYFQDYYRNHRPGYHYRTEPRGWFGKNRDYSSPSRPPHVHQSPGYSRDGRAVTPQSPWSYNPNKNDRYQPRSHYNPPPSNSDRPGWFGKNNQTQSAEYIGRPVDTPSKPPRSSGGGFWGKNKKSETPRYESKPSSNFGADDRKDRNYSRDYSSDSKPNRFTPNTSGSSSSKPSSPGSSSEGSKPGWFGKR